MSLDKGGIRQGWPMSTHDRDMGMPGVEIRHRNIALPAHIDPYIPRNAVSRASSDDLWIPAQDRGSYSPVE